MLKISRIMLALTFTLMLTGTFLWAFPVIPHAGTEADPAIIYASPTCAVVFEDTYTALGQTIVQADVQFLDTGGAPVTTYEITALAAANGVYRVPLRPGVEALPNGVYQVRCRVWDQYANFSEWGTSLYATKKWQAVGRPGGCATLP